MYSDKQYKNLVKKIRAIKKMRQKKAKINLVNVITAGNVISSTVSNVKFGYVKMSGLELYVKSF